MVTGLVVQARVAMVHLLRAEAARAATIRKDVAATKAVTAIWAAAHPITVITVAQALVRTLVDTAQVASKAAAARNTTAIVSSHIAASVIVIRKPIYNTTHV